MQIIDGGAEGFIVGKFGQGVEHAQAAAHADAKSTDDFHQPKIPAQHQGERVPLAAIVRIDRKNMFIRSLSDLLPILLNDTRGARNTCVADQ